MLQDDSPNISLPGAAVAVLRLVLGQRYSNVTFYALRDPVKNLTTVPNHTRKTGVVQKKKKLMQVKRG